MTTPAMEPHENTTETEVTSATGEVPVDAPATSEEPLAPSEQDTETLPPNTLPAMPQLAIALGGLAVVFGFSYLPTSSAENAANTVEVVPVVEQVQRAHVESAPFETVDISAHAAYVWDVREQRALYNKNAGQQLPLASLTKLMTALVASEHLGSGDSVEITAAAILQEGDSSLSMGEQFDARSLLDLTLITSSNDGAYALAAAAGASLIGANPEEAFIAAMNEKAAELELTQSHFNNPTGLDFDETTSGSYGSARDMAFLMEYLVLEHPEILAQTREASHTLYDHAGARFDAHNTNEVVTEIPGLIGSKTGYTDLAGGNLVIAFDAGLNRPIIISVLGSTREGRFTDIMELVERTQQLVSNE